MGTFTIPKWVGYDYFCEITGISKSKVKKRIRDGDIDFAKDGKNTLINLWKYFEDLESGIFELN